MLYIDYNIWSHEQSEIIKKEKTYNDHSMATTARYKRIQLTPIYIIGAKAASSATVATKLTAVTLRIKH